MPVVSSSRVVAFCCALMLLSVLGCRGSEDQCPRSTVTANPSVIPDGLSETALLVEVRDPFPVEGLVPVTELSAVSGVIDDPFALATTYTCAHDVIGPVEVCVTTTYAESDDAEAELLLPKRRGPNVYLQDRRECSAIECTEVICPEVKNQCPVISSFVIDPAAPIEVPEGETASITVDVEDPDGIPEPLMTMLSARHGEIADPSATETSYTCNPEFGGAIPICMDASDGACTDTVCELVRCPGEPAENTCPFIRDTNANPNPIPRPDDPGTVPSTVVTVSALDPDEFPGDFTIKWTSEGGGFDDPTASETIFRCGKPGRVEACVRVNDGDLDCLEDPDTERCFDIECPGGVPENLCPNLTIINAEFTEIPAGLDRTKVETRGIETDGKPLPLTLTLTALWGTFEDTENMMCEEFTPECPFSDNVVFQNAVYICDRPGQIQLCVDATDGLCMKTLCTDVFCPDDLPTP